MQEEMDIDSRVRGSLGPWLLTGIIRGSSGGHNQAGNRLGSVTSVRP